MIATTNLPKNTPESAKSPIRYRVYFARVRDEVDMNLWPLPANATINAVPMQAGKYFHYIDCKVDSFKVNAASVGEVAPEGELTIAFDIEGLSKAMLAFLFANNGEDMVVIWEHCATKQKFIAGSPCSGLIFTYTKLGNDGNYTGASCQLKGKCPDPFLFFDGTIPLEDPVVIASNAVSFALSAKSIYKVSENTAATAIADVTNITDADVNRIIEIIGNGSANISTISASTKFILKNGTQFVASDGAKITFQIVKTGAATYALYELNRS